MKQRSLILLGLAGALCGAGPPQPPVDLVMPAGPAQARYTIHWMGAQVASSALSLRLDESGYGLALTARTEGLLRTFVDARTRLEATGNGMAAQARPLVYRTDTQVRREDVRRHVTFDAQGRATVIERTLPRKGWGSQREPVPQALQAGPDPVAAMMRLFADPPASQLSLRAFDGVQSTEYRYRCMAQTEMLPVSPHTAYAGPTRRCFLSFEVIAGRAIDEEASEARERERQRPPATLWIAPVRGSSLWVPVRFEQKGRLGTVTGYLASFGEAMGS